MILPTETTDDTNDPSSAHERIKLIQLLNSSEKAKKYGLPVHINFSYLDTRDNDDRMEWLVTDSKYRLRMQDDGIFYVYDFYFREHFACKYHVYADGSFHDSSNNKVWSPNGYVKFTRWTVKPEYMRWLHRNVAHNL